MDQFEVIDWCGTAWLVEKTEHGYTPLRRLHRSYRYWQLGLDKNKVY